MVRIKPFCGIIYDEIAGGDLSSVVSPPYDVVSAEEKKRCYEGSAYNPIRLILPEPERDDSTKSGPYSRAAGLYRSWREAGILKRENSPSVYIIEREYVIEGAGKKIATGFMALMRLEGEGSDMVLPHEQIFQGPKVDRLSLLRACQVNFSPIFCLYSDPPGEISAIVEKAKGNPPLADFAHRDGTRVRLWSVSDLSVTGGIARSMEDKKVLIADGHHRHEAALSFRDESRSRNPGHTGEESYNYLMTYFTDMHDAGLSILPVHRLIRGLSKDALAGLVSELGRWFQLKTIKSPHNCKERHKKLLFETMMGPSAAPAFAIYLGEESYYLISVDGDRPCPGINQCNAGGNQAIEVSILHKLIIPRIIGMDESPARDEIYYTKSAEEAISLVDAGAYQVAFLLRPLHALKIEAVARRGETLPEKSTYFYPKLLTGLVMHEL